ncbi:MAG: T9SS type A sorting domain-containing protein [Lentimicrobiaceae bacterium]|nr:T9SS type A sorting domain-containing protein [Lentimicrobiaceae bacterium]
MNKILLLISMLFVCILLNAQQTYIAESFSDSQMPPTGWTIDTHAGNWEISNTAQAGGSAPEGMLNWSPQFNGTTRLISPAIDLTGIENVALDFRYMLDHYDGTYTIGVATKSRSGNWNVVWQDNTPSTTPATSISVLINNGDVGANDFQLCIFFSGASYNLNYWCIDDIVLYQPMALDARMSQLTVPAYISQGSKEITGVVKNVGLDNLTSFDVNWNADGGEVFTTSFSGLDLSFGSGYDFTCNDLWNAPVGNHAFKVWVSNINGAGPDNNPGNDTINASIAVASQNVSMLPLFEEFTSSTCGPCANFNSTVFIPFCNAHPNEFSLIKYQMSWPAPGDPYYTEEGGVRRYFYGVNAVPTLFLQGNTAPMTTGGLTSALTQASDEPAFVSLGIQPTYSGNEVQIPLHILPYLTVNDMTIQIAVIEKITTENVGNNGETEFHHVMMKMVPDAEGLLLNFTDGVPFDSTFTVDMSTTFVEDMNDLQVVAFVQDNSNRRILQSAFADVLITGIEKSISNKVYIYPNPASSYVVVANAGNSNILLYDMLGNIVRKADAISENYRLNTAGLHQGAYFLKIIKGSTIQTLKVNIL